MFSLASFAYGLYKMFILYTHLDLESHLLYCKHLLNLRESPDLNVILLGITNGQGHQ